MSAQYGRGEIYQGLYNGNEAFSNQDFRRYDSDGPFNGLSASRYGPASMVETRQPKIRTSYPPSDDVKLWSTDLVTNDQEFFTAASELLSTIGRSEYQTTSSIKDTDKFSSQILQLRNTFSFGQLKMFSRALEIRYRCLPLFPEPHENQLTLLIRRCERHLGQLLRIMLQVDNFGHKSDDEIRDFIKNMLEPQTVQRDQSIHEKRDDEHNQRIDGGKRNSDSNIHPSSFQKGNDFTSHIVWDEVEDSPAEGDSQKWKEQTFEREPHDQRSSYMYTSNSNSRQRSQPRTPKEGRTHLEVNSESSFLNVEDQVYSFELSNMSQTGTTDNLKEETNSIATSYALARKASYTSKAKKPRGSVETIRYAKVQAPETLPESFMFEARIDDEIFMAVVPKGGVRKGDVFESRMVDIHSNHPLEPGGRTKTFVDMASPQTRWRDGLCDCFKYGILHPMVLNSFICPHVALSQIMTRLQLNIFGEGTDVLRSRINVSAIQVLFPVLLIFHGIFLFLSIRAYFVHNHLKFFFFSFVPILVIDMIIGVYFYHLLIKTRNTLRREYSVPKGILFEDTILSLFCTPCVLAQMGRHTADYDTYAARACTKTGLSDHIEVKLPGDVSNDEIGLKV